MAIATLDEPTEFYPLYHPALFRLDSTISANLNFKYVFKLFINAVEVLRVKVSPEPVNGYGLFDVSPHLLDFLDQDVFDITAATLQAAPRVEYVIKIDEEYTDGAGNQVVNVDAKVFTEKIGFNTVLTRNELFGDLTKLQLKTGTPGELLINIEPNTLVYQDDIFFIHFAGNDVSLSQPLELRIVELNISGTPLITNVVFGIGAATARMFTMDLDAIAFNANTRYIEIFIFNSGGVIVSQSIRLRILPRPCSILTMHKLIFLDPKGSYNSINLDGASRDSFTIKDKTFRQFIDPLTDSEQARGIQSYFKDETLTFDLNTVLMSEESNSLFLNLMRSDRVFIDLRNDPKYPNVDFFPIKILTNSLTPLKAENSDIPQYNIKARFAFEQVIR